MWQETPQFVLEVTVDMTEVQRWRDQTGKKMSFTTLLVRAAAVALMQVPLLNSLFVEGELRQYAAANLSVAMATPAPARPIPVRAGPTSMPHTFRIEAIARKTTMYRVNRTTQEACSVTLSRGLLPKSCGVSSASS